MKIVNGGIEIFQGRLRNETLAVVQRCRENVNRDLLTRGYSESWPSLPSEAGVFVVSLVLGNRQRELWAGRVIDQQPSGHGKRGEQLYRIVVDKFTPVGIHDFELVSDEDFYGIRSTGSRVKIANTGKQTGLKKIDRKIVLAAPGEMIQRLAWLRKNHRQFKDPVWNHWKGKCAVTNEFCEGLLVASHITPWSESTPEEKTDFHNGLLLAAPLDSLFDRGLIGFSDDGLLLKSKQLSKTTAKIFGIRDHARLTSTGLTRKMRTYLKQHRNRHSIIL